MADGRSKLEARESRRCRQAPLSLRYNGLLASMEAALPFEVILAARSRGRSTMRKHASLVEPA